MTNVSLRWLCLSAACGMVLRGHEQLTSARHTTLQWPVDICTWWLKFLQQQL